MTIATFRMPIGSKCQVTIPKPAMKLLALGVGDDLLLEVNDDHAVLHPAVSVPRHELPEALWKKLESRRGPKPTDIPLETLFKEIGYQPKRKGRRAQPTRAVAERGKTSRSRARAANIAAAPASVATRA